MMRKNIPLVRVVILLTMMIVMGGPMIGYSESWAESANADFALQDDAPIYTGPVQEGDLEALTAEDFEVYGIESERPEDQYRQYRKALDQPVSGVLVPYRMRIVDRELAQDDFLGFGVSEELSEARYSGYLDMIPATSDGHTIHYVFVYHRPLAQTNSET